jgi:leucyl-tRNA synthetase
MIDFKAIENEWFLRWDEEKLHDTPANPRRKFFVLEMFAYPSGDIHVGHLRNYMIGDICARYRMMTGWDVLHPPGWDAFGQPAEGAALKYSIHPREWTLKNIETGRSTLQRMAVTYDWSREVRTCEPDYYKWTQWIFLQLHKAGLAYLAPSWVNWCPKDEWALTNEQSEGGVCWRCRNPVVKKKLDRCWFFRTSGHAERLLKDIDRLTQWPESVRTIQRNWIGRSEGAEVDFELEGGGKIRVFTTRPDTIYGVTFMAVSPESPLAESLATPDRRDAVAEYVRKALVRDEAQREKEKDGVFTGRAAINPFNGDKVQLWVADYVLGGYGTGVVMGVPAHDQRDFEFAKKYGLPIKVVIQPAAGGRPVQAGRGTVSIGFGMPLEAAALSEAYVEPGVMVNSGPFNGIPNEEGIRKVTEHAAEKSFGGRAVNYKLRDWLISRQRYWGCPIPIIHCATCGPVPVPDEALPVVLPTNITNFVPKGRSPLADSPEFMKTTCPKCGGAAERDPDTMDTFIDSSWYQFRYVDPGNDKQIWRQEEIAKWAPVDLYIGGIEHARGHCLYFRFITKVLHDLGHCPVDEPAVRLFNHGMVCDEKGDVMSKSKGNAQSPAPILEKWGVDVCRLAMAFFAPSEDQIKWSENGLVGAERFTRRVYELADRVKDYPSAPVDRSKLQPETQAVWRKLHQVIRKALHSYEQDLHFNTVLSHVMELLNLIGQNWDFEKAPEFKEDRCAVRIAVFNIVRIIAPMAPFLGEELYRKLGGTGSVFRSGFPELDAAAARDEEIEIVVQVNGKLRDRVQAPAGASREELEGLARTPRIESHVNGKDVVKVIVVPGKLVNFVVR